MTTQGKGGAQKEEGEDLLEELNTVLAMSSDSNMKLSLKVEKTQRRMDGRIY